MGTTALLNSRVRAACTLFFSFSTQPSNSCSRFCMTENTQEWHGGDVVMGETD